MNYDEILSEMGYYKWIQDIIDNNYGKSIEEIERLIELEYINWTSNCFFPNHVVAFYPNIKEYVAFRDILCHVCGGVIKAGSRYYAYRPMIRDVDTKRVYVLKKTMKVEIGYLELLPLSICEFEDMDMRIRNAYIDNDEKFSGILANYGELELLELRRKNLTRRR